MRGSRGPAVDPVPMPLWRRLLPSPFVVGVLAVVFAPLVSAASQRIAGISSERIATPPSQGESDGTIGRGRLLVASPSLEDPNFAETVVLLLEGGSAGAVGVVVNRPSNLELRSVLPEVKELTERRDTVFLGGPVDRSQLLLLVRAAAPPKDSMRVFQDVFVTGSMDALSHAAEERSDDVRFRLFAGYAGWGPGQLDVEIARGDWRVVPGDAERVFATAPERVWSELIERDVGRWVGLDPREGLFTSRGSGRGPAERLLPIGARPANDRTHGLAREGDCDAEAGTPTMAPPCRREPPSSSCAR